MKSINYLLSFILACTVFSCNEYDKRTIRKTIPLTRGRSIELYYYSLIGGSSPDYIDLKTKSGDYQHLFINNFICDVNVFVDTIKILSNKNSSTTFLEKNNIGLKIVIDSSGYCSHSDIAK
jgi:hypothetical protein